MSHSSGFLLPCPETQPPRQESVLAQPPRIPVSEELQNSNLVRSQRKLFGWQGTDFTSMECFFRVAGGEGVWGEAGREHGGERGLKSLGLGSNGGLTELSVKRMWAPELSPDETEGEEEEEKVRLRERTPG